MTSSPYLSLRAAVPAAVAARRALSRERDRAARLVADCEELLRLLPPPTGSPFAGSAVVDADADAEALWARVVDSAMTIATALVKRGDLDQVRRLADFFASAGEKTVAADLRGQVGEAVMERLGPLLGRVNNNMSPDQIRATIIALRTILRDVPEDSPGRNAEVNSYVQPLAASIRTLMQRRNTEISYDSRVEHIASGGVAKYPDIVDISVDELAAEFEETWPE
jgi:hypothetical protein